MTRKFVFATLLIIGLAAPVWAQEPTPAATPLPECTELDLANYATCIAACDAAAVQTCVAPGAEDHFLAALEAGITNCNYPGLDNPREWNGLKKIPGAFRQMGAITPAKARELSRGVAQCIRALQREIRNRGRNNGR